VDVRAGGDGDAEGLNSGGQSQRQCEVGFEDCESERGGNAHCYRWTNAFLLAPAKVWHTAHMAM
jgi:hypothetical protein